MQAYVNEFKEKKEIKKATNEFYKRERERERDCDLHKNQNY